MLQQKLVPYKLQMSAEAVEHQSFKAEFLYFVLFLNTGSSYDGIHIKLSNNEFVFFGPNFNEDYE